jgi:hypothetical protein
MQPGRRPANDADVVAAFARGHLDRAAERAVAEDQESVHVVVPSIAWEGPPVREVQGMKKPRSPSWCRGPWSLRSLEAPVRRVGRAV